METSLLCRRTATQALRQRTSQTTWLSRQYSIVHDVPRTTGSIPHTAPPSPAPASIFDQAVNATGPRNTWTKDEISEIYKVPLMELAYAAVRHLDKVRLSSLTTT